MPDESGQQDADELRREIARLREALKKAEVQKNEALVRLASGFSHDINNYLTPVLAYAGMLREDLPAGHVAREYADEIQLAAEKTQQVIKLMQDVRAKGQYSSAVVLNQAVSEALRDARPLIPPDVQLVEKYSDGIRDVQGDGAALKRILRELINNSLTAMPVGGDLVVETRLVDVATPTPVDGDMLKPGRYAVLSVRDQGVGMNDEVQARMYEPYYTSRERNQAKGLGLSIVYGLTRKCSGFIRCTSQYGAGTTFEIFLLPISP